MIQSATRTTEVFRLQGKLQRSPKPQIGSDRRDPLRAQSLASHPLTASCSWCGTQGCALHRALPLTMQTVHCTSMVVSHLQESMPPRTGPICTHWVCRGTDVFHLDVAHKLISGLVMVFSFDLVYKILWSPETANISPRISEMHQTVAFLLSGQSSLLADSS